MLENITSISRFDKQKKGIGSFVLVQIAGILGAAFFLFLPFIFDDYFSWISSMTIYAIIAISLLIFQIFVLIESSIFKNNFFLNISGFVWTLGYTAFIIITGGVSSNFIFLLLFIPVISLFYLDSRITFRSTILAVILLFSIIFFEPKNLLDISIWAKHLLNVFGFSFVVILAYKFSKGTIKEKSEKEQLKRRFIELNEINHTKQIFLSAMSHQLRTPLNGVRWVFESILAGSKNKSGKLLCIDNNLVKEGYDRVLQSIDIIGKILETAELEIDRKNIELKKDSINLKVLLDSIFVNLDYLIRSKMINLVKKNYNNLKIEGDAKMLDLAITNVIDNAFRYSPQGTVEVSLFGANNQAILTIEDNGIGIDMAEMEFIFQKFYRGKNAIVIDPDESGIGLYTTKKIIELHHGEIVLSSILGVGTKVRITLPLSKKI